MHKPTILVVEDQWILGYDMATILQGAGMAVVGPHGTVAEALAAIETAKFDAALIDINLPDGSGFSVATVLLKKAIPFAFASGAVPNLIPEDFRTVPFLTKPITENQLVSAA